MAEQGLDVADVGAAFEHMRGTGVAQQVAAAGLVHPGARLGPADDPRREVGGELLAPVGDEPP